MFKKKNYNKSTPFKKWGFTSSKKAHILVKKKEMDINQETTHFELEKHK